MKSKTGNLTRTISKRQRPESSATRTAELPLLAVHSGVSVFGKDVNHNAAMAAGTKLTWNRVTG